MWKHAQFLPLPALRALNKVNLGLQDSIVAAKSANTWPKTTRCGPAGLQAVRKSPNALGQLASHRLPPANCVYAKFGPASRTVYSPWAQRTVSSQSRFIPPPCVGADTVGYFRFALTA